jgi:aryl-phospho-beta-D-glucosidase BglC (GH1 family)
MSGRARSLAHGIVSVSAALVVGLLLNISFSPVAAGPRQAQPSLAASQVLRLIGSPDAATGLAPTPRLARAHSSCSAPFGWLRTQGVWVVEDKNPNCKVRLVGVTWYGMQTTSWALAGLNYQPYGVILSEIAKLGFNSIRIPISDQLVRQSSKLQIKPKYLLAQDPGDINPHIHPLQLLDKVVAAAARLNLMVILDNHFSKARAAADVSNNARVRGAAVRRDGEATWTADGYTEKQWIADWVSVAKRYAGSSNVIGFDLRNEPHTDYQHHQWTLHDYLTHGATWGPCTVSLCGADMKLWKSSSDWVAAAEKCGDAIQKVDPHALLFVEGVQLYPQIDKKHPNRVEPYWWGSILRGVTVDPVHFTLPNQLVYSPHEWGPWKCCGLNGEFGRGSTYASITKIFYQNWAFILADKKLQAPIWLGEFNTCNAAQKHMATNAPPIKTASGCVYSSKPGSQGQWFHILIQYLQKNPEIGWSYYPLNGTNVKDEESNNSILDKTWSKPRLPAIMTALKTIENQPAN